VQVVGRNNNVWAIGGLVLWEERKKDGALALLAVLERRLENARTQGVEGVRSFST
jgi:hypothetical protein